MGVFWGIKRDTRIYCQGNEFSWKYYRNLKKGNTGHALNNTEGIMGREKLG